MHTGQASCKSIALMFLPSGIALLLNVSCMFKSGSKSYVPPTPDYPCKFDTLYSPTEMDTLLLNAYKADDSDCVRSYFTEWKNAYAPISDEELSGLSKHERAVYDLFLDFYPELSILRRAGYVVLQDSIMYRVMDSQDYTGTYIDRSLPRSERDYEQITISPFRPRVRNRYQGVLYLTDEYERALNYFFNEKDGSSYCHQYSLRTDRRAKYYHMADYLLISSRHWVSGYYYYTFPQISSITFDEDMTRAMVDYRDTWCTGGMDEWIRADSSWTKTRTILTWIE